MTTKFQKFEAKVIHRSLIKNAPYNPRKISDKARAELKKNLKRVGLLETLVWNEQTGNLVSGHQRLSILDELEKTNDYELTVAVVNLDEKSEKEQNIFFNSKTVQGEFDPASLKVMDIDFSNAGFDQYDLNLFDLNPPKVVDVQEQQPQSQLDILNEIDQMADQKQRMKERKEEIRANIEAKVDEGDPYVMLSFSSFAAKKAFMLRFNLDPYDKIIKGEEFSDNIERIG